MPIPALIAALIGAGLGGVSGGGIPLTQRSLDQDTSNNPSILEWLPMLAAMGIGGLGGASLGLLGGTIAGTSAGPAAQIAQSAMNPPANAGAVRGQPYPTTPAKVVSPTPSTTTKATTSVTAAPQVRSAVGGTGPQIQGTLPSRPASVRGATTDYSTLSPAELGGFGYSATGPTNIPSAAMPPEWSSSALQLSPSERIMLGYPAYMPSTPPVTTPQLPATLPQSPNLDWLSLLQRLRPQPIATS